MKKFMTGLIAGMLIMVSMTTFAEEIESYIGKVIEGQFPVIVDGQKVDKPGLVIEGTTYLPVRATAELFGYDIAFIDSQVILNKKVVATVQEVEKPVEHEPIVETEEMTLPFIESEIERLTLQLNSAIDAIGLRKKVNPDDPYISNFEEIKIEIEEKLAELKRMKKELQETE